MITLFLVKNLEIRKDKDSLEMNFYFRSQALEVKFFPHKTC